MSATVGTVATVCTIVTFLVGGMVVLFRVRPESQTSLLAGQQAELRRLMDDRQATEDRLEARLDRCEKEADDLRRRLQLAEERAVLAEKRAFMAESAIALIRGEAS